MLSYLTKFRSKILGLAILTLTAGSLLSAMTASASIPPSMYTFISNPNFETGNLSGWAVTGDTFTATSDTNWGWGGDFNHNGSNHVWGSKNGDSRTGTMKSSIFYTSGGNSYVDFLIGGGNDINNLYVALVKEDGTVLNKATGTNDEKYRRVIWSVPAGINAHFEVVDNATGGWGHINVDDFHTTTSTIASGTYTDLINHDFEMGNLTGWSVESGTAFSTGDVATDTNWWGGTFNQNGAYHLSSLKEGSDGDTGVLKSGAFTLGGFGNIDFLISGGNDLNNLYVALVRASDGSVLFKATGANSEQYTRVSWDAANYIGETLYMKVVDTHTGGWGHVNLDDVNVQVQPKELFNHNFGYGNYNDLRGWTVVSGNAFDNPDVTFDETWAGGSFNKEGTSHLWGYKSGGDNGVGVLKSENFVLSGNGQVDFLIGGGNDINNLYVALTRVSDGAELFKATGNNTETYSRVQWDASQYLGTELYIKVVDNATNGWGHMNIDDVNVQIQSGMISSDTQAPTAPSNLNLWRQRGTEVSFGWTASTDNIGVYSYLVNINGGETYTRNQGTGYTFNGNSGGTYTIKVKAIDAAGNLTGYSNTLVVTIP